MLQGYPLSPLQKRLWQLSQPGQERSYRAEAVLLIEGDLRIDALERAWREVAANCEILQTSFRRLPEMHLPLQVIDRGFPPLPKYFDFSQSTPPHQETRIQDLMNELWEQGEASGARPAISVALVKLSFNRHKLLIALPSLYADEVTLGNLMRELAFSYAGQAERKAPNDEPVQYSAISAWLNEFIESADAAIGREYWRKQGSADLFKTGLPFELHPINQCGFRPRSLICPVEPEVGIEVTELAARHNTPVDTVLLACWQTLLWRLTGQEEIKIGVACDGRTDQLLIGAMGLLSRYLILPARIRRETRFDELLADIESKMHQARLWQECFNWEEIAGANAQGDALAFFPICFDFTEDPLPVEAEEVTFSLCRRRSIFDRFKLRLACRWGSSPVLELLYDSSLFRETDLRHLLGQFQTLLEQAAHRPGARATDLETVDEVGRQQLLVEFNDTKNDLPERSSFSSFIEDLAVNAGDRVALTFNDEHLTFDQLNVRSNQTAHYLRKLSISPEDKVAVLIARSPDLVIGLLGIAKAGGAYVPLEPDYPGQRLDYILREARIDLILTRERDAGKLREYPQKIVCLDSAWAEIAVESPDNPVHLGTAEELAYVIYTSGSTGLPKGVMVTHRGLLNYLTWCVEAYEIEHGRGAPVHSPIGFDLTITALLAPLVAGRGIDLIDETKGIEALTETLAYPGSYSLVKLTPAHLDLVNQLLHVQTASRSARRLVIGGESLSRDRVAFWREHAPQTILINEYGPTETVVGCCVYEVPREGDLPPAIPIGRPIANARLYLVDRQLEALSVGMPGELLIGGEGVARGYLSQPALTADKFIPDPFSVSHGGRVYRTGDLAYFRSDGQLEFLGRVDDQVKLRGLRIELGEISAVLKQHPAVREAIACLQKAQSGADFLVAYLVVYSEMPGIDQLREFIRPKLPDYMIPSQFIRLERLPLTANGKVDFRALPAPDKSRQLLETDEAAPRSPVEDILAEIWLELLKVERVSIYDNFFEMGGNSLIATQVITRLHKVFKIELPLRSIFQAPTIKGLAETLYANESSPGQVDAVARLRRKIEGMSTEEIRMLIQEKRKTRGTAL